MDTAGPVVRREASNVSNTKAVPMMTSMVSNDPALLRISLELTNSQMQITTEATMNTPSRIVILFEGESFLENGYRLNVNTDMKSQCMER